MLERNISNNIADSGKLNPKLAVGNSRNLPESPKGTGISLEVRWDMLKPEVSSNLFRKQLDSQLFFPLHSQASALPPPQRDKNRSSVGWRAPGRVEDWMLCQKQRVK